MRKTFTILFLSVCIIFNVSAQGDIDPSFFKKYFKSEYMFYIAMHKYGHYFTYEEFSSMLNGDANFLQLEDVKKIETSMNNSLKWSYIQDRFRTMSGDGEEKVRVNNVLSFKSEYITAENSVKAVDASIISVKLPILKNTNKVLDVESPFSFSDEIELEPKEYQVINFISRDFIENPNRINDPNASMLIEGDKFVNYKHKFNLIEEINKGSFILPFRIKYAEKAKESKITANSIGEEIQIDEFNFKIKEIRNNQIVFLEPLDEMSISDFKNFEQVKTVNISGDSKVENKGAIIVIADKVSLDFIDKTIDEDELLEANENHFQKINTEADLPIGIAIFMQNEFDDHIKLQNGIMQSYEFKISSPELTLTKQ